MLKLSSKNMKYLLITLYLLCLNPIAFSQQNTFIHLSNTCLTQSYTLKNVTEINNYREQISTPYIVPDVISKIMPISK